jgi:hypothetical protein
MSTTLDRYVIEQRGPFDVDGKCLVMIFCTSEGAYHRWGPMRIDPRRKVALYHSIPAHVEFRANVETAADWLRNTGDWLRSTLED